MPDFRPYTRRHLREALRKIGEMIYYPLAPLEIEAWCTAEPLPFEDRFEGTHRSFRTGDKWGGLFDCAWFRFTGTVPARGAGRKIVLLLDVNGEMCVVDDDGTPLRGLTTMASGYDFRLGSPGKRVLQFLTRAVGGERVDVWADAGCNDLFGNLQGNGTIAQAEIAVCDDEVYALYHDYEVLLDCLEVLPADSARYEQIATALSDAVHVLLGPQEERVDLARQALAPMLARRGGDPSLRISAIGHAHIDLAWLWPIRETIRKGARTFATALELMNRYPEYVFGASQAQLFLWMKEHYPSLYARIQARVRDGRLEVQGAMWVEADTNVSGGEALARQVLYGKRFFRQEFGVDIDYLWLPDVFGYSAALPQILRHGGVRYFLTQKISWNQINPFPHHSFHWQGIDGSQVLAHMYPEDTYNSPAAPRSLHKIETNYRDKGVSTHALMVFGIGDGGGGPGEEHLERLRRIADLAGFPPVQQEPVAAFLPAWASEANRFATWVGELYLERHQGTLTTEARNKWYNRRLELSLRDWEWIASIAQLECGRPYPGERLLDTWREVLLYQFHDILPGSSIKRVYDESVARYEELYAEVEEAIAENGATLEEAIDTSAMHEPLVVHNTISWERVEWVRSGDRWLRVRAPSMGYTTVDASDVSGAVPEVVATAESLENDVLRVRFAEDGSILSVYDKELDREAIAGEQRANRLVVYADLGDAWDFAMDYAASEPRQMTLVSATPQVDGPRAVLTHVYRLGCSELVQNVSLVAGSRRIEFETHVRWREPATMLRTSFPVAVHAEAATYEIQYGHLQRPTHCNTTWDLARDEVVGHKWVDLSQGDYGVALLNDSKYGHRVKGNVLDLNLLRSAYYPGPRLVTDEDVAPGAPHEGYTDQCDHEFTYALYPHPGDAMAGGVVRAGYALNVPLRVLPATAHGGSLPHETSLIAVDAPNVVVEAVKRAEDGDDLIVRLYECAHAGAKAAVRLGFSVSAAAEVNLMEEDPHPVVVDDGIVRLSFRPFEIKTLRLSL
ncbi:MAG: alpha-mannosidase [Anaerolineae bacterium]|nr:alpha-mannosidase [Anaerolineae bacterium]